MSDEGWELSDQKSLSKQALSVACKIKNNKKNILIK